MAERHLQTHPDRLFRMLADMQSLTARQYDQGACRQFDGEVDSSGGIFHRIFEGQLQTACESTRIAQTADADTGIIEHFKQSL